jgi:GNAT superfamily N-acetyltransferase
MPSNPPSAFNHPQFSETLLPTLHELLPYPLPLYRRLQFPFHSASSHILASFPPDDLCCNHPPETRYTTPEQMKAPKCFAAAFVDRSRRPETECFLFLSSEVPNRCSENCQSCQSALLALIRHIKTLPFPDSVHTNITSTSQQYLTHLANPNIILIGGIHAFPANLLRSADLIDTSHPGLEYTYIKYLFRTSTLPAPSDLPDGLCWERVIPSDFELVRSRTAIPRQDATLALLPSMAIHSIAPDSETSLPIAWTFLGVDASLTSLHVEPEWRGKGLAKKLASKIFGDRVVFNGEGEEDMWAHADVAVDNLQSQGVCKSLGGEQWWTVYWIRLDLGRVN